MALQHFSLNYLVPCNNNCIYIKSLLCKVKHFCRNLYNAEDL